MKAKYAIGTGEHKIVLATVCPECDDQPAVTTDGPAKCLYCDGYGFLTTSNGAQILALARDVLLKDRK